MSHFCTRDPKTRLNRERGLAERKPKFLSKREPISDAQLRANFEREYQVLFFRAAVAHGLAETSKTFKQDPMDQMTDEQIQVALAGLKNVRGVASIRSTTSDT